MLLDYFLSICLNTFEYIKFTIWCTIYQIQVDLNIAYKLKLVYSIQFRSGSCNTVYQS